MFILTASVNLLITFKINKSLLLTSPSCLFSVELWIMDEKESDGDLSELLHLVLSLFAPRPKKICTRR